MKLYYKRIFLGGDRKYEGDGRFGGVFSSAPQHRNGMSVHKGLTTLIGAALGATDRSQGCSNSWISSNPPPGEGSADSLVG